MATKGSRVVVVELDDEVGPRRNADQPNLYVTVTTHEPADLFARLQGPGRRHGWVRGHAVQLRHDLVASDRPTTRAAALRQRNQLMEQLKQRGFTVNRDARTWRLYVVQLDESRTGDVGAGWVYVGQTTLTVDERHAQHLDGARNRKGPLFSRVVRRYGQQLRRDLFEHLDVIYTGTDARRAEAALADALRSTGYRVEGGH